MNEQVVHQFPIIFTNTTPVNTTIFSLPQIITFFFLISKKKYIKRTSRKQEANEREQGGTQTKRKHKRKQKANRAEKN